MKNTQFPLLFEKVSDRKGICHENVGHFCKPGSSISISFFENGPSPVSLVKLYNPLVVIILEISKFQIGILIHC